MLALLTPPRMSGEGNGQPSKGRLSQGHVGVKHPHRTPFREALPAPQIHASCTAQTFSKVVVRLQLMALSLPRVTLCSQLFQMPLQGRTLEGSAFLCEP